MLSFKQLSEKKTKVKINPKLDELKEKKGTCPKTGDAECKCDKKEKTPAQRSVEGKANSMEEQAYVSQEEVSEESTEKIAETETSLLTFGQFTEGLSIDDQMRISREAAAKRKPYKDGDHQRARAKQLKNAAKNAKKDTRTDAQKMTDATGPRPGSRYRGD